MMVPTIFQVEDDDDFSFLMEHALKEISKDITLTIALNGSEGMELITR